MNRQLTKAKGQMCTSIFSMCQTRGLAHAESRNTARAFSKKGVAPLWAELPPEQGSRVPSLPFSQRAGETIASFIEAFPRAKPLAPQGGGDAIPLPVDQCGLRAPGSWPSNRTASLLGAGPGPQGCLLRPRAVATGGRCCSADAPVSPVSGGAVMPAPALGDHKAGPFLPLLSGREVTAEANVRNRGQRSKTRQGGGGGGAGRTPLSHRGLPLQSICSSLGLSGQAGKLGQASGLVCCSAAAANGRR